MKFKEMVGEYGSWTIVEKDMTKRFNDSNAYWICRCKCGTIRSVSGNHLRRGTSVSCRKCSENKHKGTLNSRTWNRILRNARERGFEVKVSKEYLYDLLYCKQKCMCALTGVEINLSNTIKDDMTGKSDASPDRIDSSKGYIKDNVQWVHKQVNRMKWNMTEARFVEFCKLVAEHSKSKIK